MINKNLVVIATLSLISGFIGSYIYSTFRSPTKITQQEANSHSKSVRQSGFKYINPLLECEVGEESDFKELKSFRTDLQAVIDRNISNGKATHVSAYFRDLNNGPWIGINERESFSPASLLKVPLLLSYYYDAQTNPKILQEELLYNGSFDLSAKQNIAPSNTIQPNQKYTIQKLIEHTIQQSDNNAARSLSLNLNSESFFRPYKDLGLPLPAIELGEYYIRVKDYATFFRILFNASYLDREYSERALSVLTNVEYDKGLRRGLPKEIEIAHKFGEREWSDTKEKQIHDCGIIYYPAHPYLLCVMTRGKDFAKLSDVISEISAQTYNEVDRQIRQSQL